MSGWPRRSMNASRSGKSFPRDAGSVIWLCTILISRQGKTFLCYHFSDKPVLSKLLSRNDVMLEERHRGAPPDSRRAPLLCALPAGPGALCGQTLSPVDHLPDADAPVLEWVGLPGSGGWAGRPGPRPGAPGGRPARPRAPPARFSPAGWALRRSCTLPGSLPPPHSAGIFST